jgi:ABC-type antimicrobial peptide transport system permease subunit
MYTPAEQERPMEFDGATSRMFVAMRCSASGWEMAIGLAGAWVPSSPVRSFVFGVRPSEPFVYLAVCGFVVLVGFAAALVPAVRAARLDPLTALRQE